MAIPVGRVTVARSFGETVERDLHAVVQNTYANNLDVENVEDLEAVAAKTVCVTFSVEALEGDVERGLFATTGSIGKVVSDGEAIMLYGQRLARETYEHNKVPVLESSNAGLTPRNSTFLYGADTLDKASADRQLAIVNAELPTMRDTLNLVQYVIQQA